SCLFDVETNSMNRYAPDLGLEDAIHIALLTIKEGFDGDKNIQLSCSAKCDHKKMEFQTYISQSLPFLLSFLPHLVSFVQLLNLGTQGNRGTKKQHKTTKRKATLKSETFTKTYRGELCFQ
ncbi:proteasome subunit alpha type 2, partial [Reticulomyxa filosa]